MFCRPRPISPHERRICASSGAEPPPDCRDWRQAHTWNKGHGRLELRELIASTELNEWRASTWPGVEQVFWVQRTTYRQGQWHIQTVYGLTNLSPKQASAVRLLEIVRRHGAIENRLRLSARCNPGRRSLPGAQRGGPAGAGRPQQYCVGCVRFVFECAMSHSKCAAWMPNQHRLSDLSWVPC